MSNYKEYKYSSLDYDHTSDYILTPLFEIMERSAQEKILDIGCGNGGLTNLLIENGYDSYGMDASKSGIAIAKKI